MNEAAQGQMLRANSPCGHRTRDTAAAIAVTAGMVALAVSIVMLCACSGNAAAPLAVTATVPADAITKITENGPVKATVRVWPAKPTLDGPITVQLEVDTEPGVSVDLPFQEAGVGRFRVEHYERDTRREANGHAVQVQTYTLVAPSSGRHRVPPFRIEMLDARASTLTLGPVGATTGGTGSGSGAGSGAGSGGTGASGSGFAGGAVVPTSGALGATASAGARTEVLTEEISLAVEPVQVSKSNAELRPAAGELAVKVGGWSRWYYALIGVGIIWLALGVVLLRRLRARDQIARKRTAYDTAVARLVALESAGAPDGATADPWFVELSGVVRLYLEDRYDIAAPERTTEEFLTEAAKAAELTAEHRALLSAFLDRCDRVKFAGYQPDSAESLATLKAARGFVEDSRLRTEVAA